MRNEGDKAVNLKTKDDIESESVVQLHLRHQDNFLFTFTDARSYSSVECIVCIFHLLMNHLVALPNVPPDELVSTLHDFLAAWMRPLDPPVHLLVNPVPVALLRMHGTRDSLSAHGDIRDIPQLCHRARMGLTAFRHFLATTTSPTVPGPTQRFLWRTLHGILTSLTDSNSGGIFKESFMR